MKLNTDHIVVIGFPHNQKSGGLGPEVQRSLDGLYHFYREHVRANKLSLLYVSGTSRSTMKPKKFDTELLMDKTLELSTIIHNYKGCILPNDIASRNVGVILLIHGTSGFPKIFAAQTSTQYIKRDNSYNGHVIARLLNDLGLSACIEKLQLVMCGGAQYHVNRMTLLQGLCEGIEAEKFKQPPMVIGWDCEVTHQTDGALLVSGEVGLQVDLSHRHEMVYKRGNEYSPSDEDSYKKITSIQDSYFFSPTGYVRARALDWSARRAVRTTGRCVLL